MKNLWKRIVGLVLTLVTVVAFVPPFTQKVEAASGLTLTELQAKFPAGMYWNHYVSDYTDAADYQAANWINEFQDSVTSVPCANHSGGWGYSDYVGKYDCNAFIGGMQCWAFARKLAYDAYGTYVYNWGTTTIGNVKPGDVVQYYGAGADPNYGHTVFVTGVSGTTITVAECNWGGRCLIGWGRSFDLRNASSYTIWSAPYALPDGGEDLGTNFYAYIINTKHWMMLTNDSNNISLRSETGSPRQVWYFERLNDGSYKITSAYDGNCIDVANAETTAGTNVQALGYAGHTAQQWFINGFSGAYTFRSKCASTVLDVTNSSSAEGTNVQMWTNNGSAAQLFQVWKLDNYAKPSVSSSASTVNLTLDSKLNQTITIKKNGYYGSNYRFDVFCNNSNVTCSLGTLNNGTASLVIKAASAGASVITIKMVDTNTKEVVASNTVNVSVSYSPTLNGLKTVGNEKYLFQNGVVRTDFTGVHKHGDGRLWYIVNGKFTPYTGLKTMPDGTKYLFNWGIVKTDFTGVHKHGDGRLYYIVNGKFNPYNGLKTVNGVKYLLKGGIVNTSFTGVHKHGDGKLYYIVNGVFNAYSGLKTMPSGEKYLLKGGIVRSDFTGAHKHGDGKLYYIVNGKFNPYNGLKTMPSGEKYLFKGGIVNTSFTGLHKHGDGNYYYIVSGKFNAYTGTCKIDGITYTIRNGKAI